LDRHPAEQASTTVRISAFEFNSRCCDLEVAFRDIKLERQARRAAGIHGARRAEDIRRPQHAESRRSAAGSVSCGTRTNAG